MMKETTLINQYSLQKLLAENGSVLESYSFTVNDVDNFVDGYDQPKTIVFRDCDFLSTFNLACGWNVTARFENCRFYRPVYFYACPKAEMVKCSFGDNSRFNVTDLLLDSCVFNLLSTSDSLVHGYLVCVYDADSLKIVDACGWPEVSPLNVDSISIKDSDLCGLHTARHSFNSVSQSTISVESSIVKNLHILHQNAMLSLTDTTVDNVRLEHAMVAVPTYSKSSIKKTFAAIESQVKYSDCFTPDCIEKIPTFPAYSPSVPKTPFVMYKKLSVFLKLGPLMFRTKKPVIAKLTVPTWADRRISKSGKVRVSEAYVSEFSRPVRFPYTARSIFDRDYKYTVGKTAVPNDDFDLSSDACASGIHGFLTRSEADSY